MLSAKDFLASYQHASQHQHAEQGRLLTAAKRAKRKLADLATGRLVRIRLAYPSEGSITGLYPPRVAALVCQVLGEPQHTARRGGRCTLTTQGRRHAADYPEQPAGRATRALLSHAHALTTAERRRRRA